MSTGKNKQVTSHNSCHANDNSSFFTAFLIFSEFYDFFNKKTLDILIFLADKADKADKADNATMNYSGEKRGIFKKLINFMPPQEAI